MRTIRLNAQQRHVAMMALSSYLRHYGYTSGHVQVLCELIILFSRGTVILQEEPASTRYTQRRRPRHSSSSQRHHLQQAQTMPD